MGGHFEIATLAEVRLYYCFFLLNVVEILDFSLEQLYLQQNQLESVVYGTDGSFPRLTFLNLIGNSIKEV